MSTYLIIYRVADGTAWSKEAMESRTLTSFRAAGRDSPDEAKRRARANVQFTSEFAVSGQSFTESKLQA